MTNAKPAIDIDLPYGPQQTPPDVVRMRRIGFLIFPEIEMIDLCGPMDVFVHADNWMHLTGRVHEPGYEIVVIAKEAGPVRSAGGLQIMAARSFADDIKELDTLIVPGSPFIELVCQDDVLIEWLRHIAPRARRIVSVCTGAFLLAAAGLLKNRQVTTHWFFCDRLAAAHPSLHIDRDRIYVRDGHIYTSGGITAGIDLALALLEEDLGREASRFVAGMMVMFLRRPGGQNQFSAFLQAESTTIRSDFRELQAWILANPAQSLDVERLADRVAMSTRNFARQFCAETGMTPAKFVEHARLEAARCKLEQTDLRLEAVAEATGFGSAERMQRSFQRLLNVTPRDYRARFQSTNKNRGEKIP
jgi:transcriptional regulator GlxA family with amidase domain